MRFYSDVTQAVRDALSKQINNDKAMLLLKEVLDADYSQKIIEVFRHLESRFKQVLIISHNDHVLAGLPNKIDVKMDNGQSKVTVTRQ